ncbi:putative alpha-1,3-glucan synthase [Microthyrium microscopicum]|uniref:alpha-1,3-glucan synthase n=1 Tax=Microthyrium microscopicum TaxID=703497 RepID=A0A6A6U282_9PEZI|nr:putative alpha-1,3-glucan synthase [Microthyrium microscopicum]
MFLDRPLLWIILGSLQCLALRYDPLQVGFNLNENQSAVEPKDYWGQWDNHTYNPSPKNWRFPFYALTIDRFIDGDPTNNEANGTVFEHDWMSNQFRAGGDAAGLLSDLDYLEGMGIKAIYLTGSMMINTPWSPDGYGPLDHTLLDRHHGSIADWRAVIDEIHRRGMYVVLDHTMATMGNLLGYAGSFENSTVNYNFDEYDYIWKDSERRYNDFEPSNNRDPSCTYPRIYEQNGYLTPGNITSQFHGCRDSEFEMYGDIKSTGAYPSYINQFSRFAAVQDRLREWRPDVLEKINAMTCIQIATLDIDGFRVDKAVQATVDALAEFTSYQRQCAKRYGKNNFLVVGEVVADPRLAAVYIGRGKQPNQELSDASQAVLTTGTTDPNSFVRPFGSTALDGAAFHYDFYGSLTRFLGLDSPWGVLGVDWASLWNQMLQTNDFVNAMTGEFDPRHIFGTTNQDVFRWPALANGTQRQLLGFFVSVLEMPGAPMVFFGEEQEHYILENLASDYVFGRAPMVSSRAWQMHGCYGLGEEVYVDMPFNKSAFGCHDDSVSLDHRDPSHPVRNLLKRMFELRNKYPVLNDGFNLTSLSERVTNKYLKGSGKIPSTFGLWSVYRGRSAAVQDFSGTGHGNLPVWLVFHNEPESVSYNFDCNSSNNTAQDGSLVSAFTAGTRVKNLFYPYDEYTLEKSQFTHNFENATGANGCIPQISFKPWEFKAFVPSTDWEQASPVITNVSPRHDTRINSTVAYDKTETVTIQIGFSMEMDCDSVTKALILDSTTELGTKATLKLSSVACNTVGNPPSTHLVGEVPTVWTFKADIENVANGVHTYTVNNATSKATGTSTGSKDKFMFRIGQSDNPMVFPMSSNYTKGIAQIDSSTNAIFVTPRAAGADKFRYSTNWGSSFSSWQSYKGGKIQIQKQNWTGTKAQAWTDDHIMLEYWSSKTGSSNHIQHTDVGRDKSPPRRWPHAWVQGQWNQYGYDAGIPNQMSQNSKGLWTFNLFNEWPTTVLINVWGMNPDGRPDKSASYGDVDKDGVLDWLPPDTLAQNVLNITTTPQKGKFGYRLVVNDGTYQYSLIPHGSTYLQLAVMLLICIIPPLTAFVGARSFMAAFYKVKYNSFGAAEEGGLLCRIAAFPRKWFAFLHIASLSKKDKEAESEIEEIRTRGRDGRDGMSNALAASAGAPSRRTVLVATMEYEIAEWNIKIKIGGLGVMASLMTKHLAHQNLIWVVPCAGGIDYPVDESLIANIDVDVLGETYSVAVYEHISDNITYVLLDAPIFRKRTKSEPYPPRMDDLESGIYYSAWNQCIAEAIRRYNPDIYHINDYHGSVAPLYLLPSVIPCCLSLHNAEFQGMWPLRTSEQLDEISSLFNLSPQVIQKYVQFGNVFNLLHAASRYLWTHQAGYGAVGVSKKYSKRVLERYPIFWCLKEIGSLPNPDPSDTAPWERGAKLPEANVDREQEEQRAIYRAQTQEWAGLKVDSTAELFIFVGRWSQQKGVDLIADVFPAILHKNKNTQLICVGPVIDLYGKFAALKLQKLMEKYPDRVFSKPEFTSLPPYIFSGAEFALMPSRDEPFGLVAVEFGRKGALCIGSRVGGFGHMPGWWFTVESISPRHMRMQFKSAIFAALKSDGEERALMRARAVVQRFPVAQWIEDLEKLQTESIKANRQVFRRGKRNMTPSSPSSKLAFPRAASPGPESGLQTPPLREELEDFEPPKFLSRVGSFINLRGSTEVSPAPSRPGSSAAFSRNPSRPTSVRHKGGRPRASLEWADENRSHLQLQIPILPIHSRPGSSSSSIATNSPLAGSPAASPRLSLDVISQAYTDMSIQRNVAPTFSDSKEEYYHEFSEKLDKGNLEAPRGSICVEDYLVESEKEWFKKLHVASLQRNPASSTENLVGSRGKSNLRAEFNDVLGDRYEAPRGVQGLLQQKLGTWPLYCYILALGQLICASSLQITLLTGAIGEPAEKLYTLCAIYFASSLMWWIGYRRLPTVYVLSLPFLFFGLSFFLLGISIGAQSAVSKGWIFDTAAGLYTIGSAAGCLYFALNFGTEGGTPTSTWAFRACAITGTQQLLIAFMVYWSAGQTRSQATGEVTNSFVSAATLTGISIPLAIIMWIIGAVLFYGLPNYYHQTPGGIPSIYTALLRRPIVVWFWIMVILQGYWLSSSFARNWLFLWSSQNAPSWTIFILILIFFVVVWYGALMGLSYFSKEHSWIIPIIAIGLGAPRWAQTLWAISGISLHIPWAGVVGSVLVSRSVWLWLGVLASIQDVGFGMILLMTLTRVHIIFALVVAQMVGAMVTLLARATAPNKYGPGPVFINLASDSLLNGWFWFALICQIVVCFGYLKFFRKAQLVKP